MPSDKLVTVSYRDDNFASQVVTTTPYKAAIISLLSRIAESLQTITEQGPGGRK